MPTDTVLAHSSARGEVGHVWPPRSR